MLFTTAFRIFPGRLPAPGISSLKRLEYRGFQVPSSASCETLQLRGHQPISCKAANPAVDSSPLDKLPERRNRGNCTSRASLLRGSSSHKPGAAAKTAAWERQGASSSFSSVISLTSAERNRRFGVHLQSPSLILKRSIVDLKRASGLSKNQRFAGTAKGDCQQLIQSMASPSDSQAAPMERKPSKVAVAQMRSTGDIQANFESVAKLVKEAVSAGCSMLFLPESFAFIGTRGSEGVAIAEQLDGPLMGRYRQLARDHSIWLSLGGFQESTSEPDRLHNTHVILNASGDVTAAYRKVHLFDVDVPNGPKLLESASTVPGSELVVTDCPAGRLGVTTCYDLRFPQMYQQLRFKLGAEILLVPSAFTKTTGEAHWEVLLRARAIECQCYVIAAAQAGRHNEKRESFGDAIIIDPWGRIIARLDDPLAVGIATAEIDLAYLQSVRTSMPVAQHRRYDIYGETTTKESHGVRSTL